MPLGIKIPRNVFSQGREKLTEFEEDVQLPPGNHVCILKDIRGVDTKKGPSIVFEFRIGTGCVEKSLEGCKITLWFSLDPERVQWLLKAFSKFGIDPSSIDEDNIEEAARTVLDLEPVCLIGAKNDGEYTNYRLVKYLDNVSASDYATDKSKEKSAEPAAVNDPVEVEEEPAEEPAEEPQAEDRFTKMKRPELVKFLKDPSVARQGLKAFTTDTDDVLRAKCRTVDKPPF